MDYIDRLKVRIQELREEKGLSVYALAQKADVTATCIRNWYTKRNYSPSLETIEKVARALEISVSQLMLDVNEEMVAVRDEEKEILQNWWKLDKEQRKVIFSTMETFLKH